MNIEIKTKPTDRVLELGGGAKPVCRPNVDVRMCHDEKGNPTVDLVADFNQPLPIPSGEYDGIFSQFVIEHLSWRKVRQFVSEMYRIVRPGGKICIITANTEAQIRYIQSHPNGWEDRPPFESASCILFGDQDYPENTHRNYMSPAIITALFQEAGFSPVQVQPFGAIKTDLIVEASRPMPIKQPDAKLVTNVPPEVKKTVEDSIREQAPKPAPDDKEVDELIQKFYGDSVIGKLKSDEEIMGGGVVTKVEQVRNSTTRVEPSKDDRYDPPQPSQELKPSKWLLDAERDDMGLLAGGGPQQPSQGVGMSLQEAIDQGLVLDKAPPKVTPKFDRSYFDNHRGSGQFYWDYPANEIMFRKVLEKRPKSVLELGCGRGYLLKRFQDSGIGFAQGLETSKHCLLTRACNGILNVDITSHWSHLQDQVEYPVDLCLSVGVLEHLPESKLPQVLREMKQICKRGLHAITFSGREPWPDPFRITLRPREWWVNLFRKVIPSWPVEIVDYQEFMSGSLPHDYLEGDGKVKLNVGSYMTMFHHGWQNLDVHDLSGFAQAFGYRYQVNDARLGLPYQTGVVDLIYSSHMLEHLSYGEGISFLRECRRVIRPEGVMRLIVPDARFLSSLYNNSPQEEGTGLEQFDEINEGCENAPTAAGKLYALLHENHKAVYDTKTLIHALNESGWEGHNVGFRHTTSSNMGKQILRETVDMLPCLSLYVDAVPSVRG